MVRTIEADYFENILLVWQKLGRQPKYQEMTAPLSRLNISSYERKFGTWRKALELFIDYVNAKDNIDEETEIEAKSEPTSIQVNSIKAASKKHEEKPID